MGMEAGMGLGHIPSLRLGMPLACCSHSPAAGAWPSSVSFTRPTCRCRAQNMMVKPWRLLRAPAGAPAGCDKSKLPVPPPPAFFSPPVPVSEVSPRWQDPLVVTVLCCLPQVSVYQVLEKSEPEAPGGKKLLAARLVPLQGSGWEVFAITQAVSASPHPGGTEGVCVMELFFF